MNINEIKKHWAVIFYLSWSDIRSRYVRSVIGPFWLVLTTAISVLGLSYIWSILFNLDKNTFIPSLTIGLIIWQFIAACISEAPHCFSMYHAIIKNYSLPIWIYPVTLVFKNLIIFFHNLIIVAIVLIFYPQELGWKSFSFFPAMFLVVAVLIQIVIILAFIGARYKDFGAAVTAFMSIAFFLSPVVFRPEQLGVKEFFMWFNPFSYLITLIRDPITGYLSSNFVYIVSIIFLLISSYTVNILLNRYRFRIVYWI